jgi:hypothetical protein
MVDLSLRLRTCISEECEHLGPKHRPSRTLRELLLTSLRVEDSLSDRIDTYQTAMMDEVKGGIWR